MKINQVKFTIHTKIKTGYSIFMVWVWTRSVHARFYWAKNWV